MSSGPTPPGQNQLTATQTTVKKRTRSGLGYVETTPENGLSRGKASFTKRASSSTRDYVLFGLTNANAVGLQQMVTDILGATDTGTIGSGPRKGCLQRTLPRCDPAWPYLVATDISGVGGIGDAVWAAAQKKLEVEPVGDWAYYPTYGFQVTYEQLPYPLLRDDKIKSNEHLYYDDEGIAKTAVFAGEWERYCYWLPKYQFNYVTARQGQMVFRTTAGAPGGTVFLGMPRIALPDYVVKFRWMEVPYRYVTSTNSHLNKFVGRVNQFAWNGWGRGELLYLGYDPCEVYSPPVNSLSPFAPGGNAVISTDKLCDIEFTFLATKREIAPGADAAPPAPAKGNWIPAGHNLLPWLQSRLFHYVTVRPSGADDPAKWTPSWLSFPFELLFTDPDI